MGKKVISYCFYYDTNSKVPFLYYLCGLRASVKIFPLLFDGWELWIYLHSSVTNKFVDISNLLKNQRNVYFKPIPPMFEKSPLLARYIPFFDNSVEYTVIRDIDSVLTENDAEILHDWITNKKTIWLVYREYQMGLPAMGGGIALWGSLSERTYCDKWVDNKRGFDEVWLKIFLSKHRTDSVTVYYTRMNKWGTYYLSNKDGTGPYKVLWPISIDPSRSQSLKMVLNPPINYYHSRNMGEWVR